MTPHDYYQILGVSKEASAKQIKDAFRKLAFQYHPDRSQGVANAERMKQINEAYAVLSDPLKRRDYDALLDQFGAGAHDRFRGTYSQQDIFRGTDIHQIFEEMARSFGLRGFDEIFKDFYGDDMKSFHYRRPGFFAGGFIFSGWPGRQSTLRGKLLSSGSRRLIGYLLNKVAGLAVPQKGSDTHDTIRLHPDEASEGGPYAYYHSSRAKKLIVKIPPGIRDGQKIRLARMGDDGENSGPAGDLYLTVRVKQPLREKLKSTLGGLLGR